MPSNHFMYVCVPCRNVTGYSKACPECGEDRKSTYKWSPPKKNNDRAWKRIEKGEWLWDRRRVNRRFKGRDTYTTWETIVVIDEDCDCDDFFCRWRHVRKHTERVPGSEREVVNYNRRPDVDMGG